MGDFKLKTWLIKYGKGLVIVLSSTGLLYTANHLEMSELPPEYAFWGGLIAVCCSQVGNWIKHSFLVE